MQTLIISLPDDIKQFMDEQIAKGVFKNHSDYIQALLIEDKQVQLAADELLGNLKDKLIKGANSPQTGEADEKYIESLREHVRKIAEK
jgi:antitoxin ParD1/3/4